MINDAVKSALLETLGDPNLDRALRDINYLMEILDNPELLARYANQLAARRAQRAARHEARVRRAYAALTDKAEAMVTAYVAGGACVNKFATCRSTGNVAVMLVRDNVWDHKKGRMGRKLIMVYPDGTRTETMERSISVKQQF